MHGSSSSSGGIGFRKDDEAVEFISDPRQQEYLRPIKIELAELRSYMMVGKNEIIFIQNDGSTLNPFIFERSSTDNFTSALGICTLS